MCIMPSNTVSLRSQPLNMQIWIPALEGTGAVLDTANHIVAVEERYFRFADRFLDRGFLV
jgi:hypothetical protein